MGTPSRDHLDHDDSTPVRDRTPTIGRHLIKENDAGQQQYHDASISGEGADRLGLTVVGIGSVECSGRARRKDHGVVYHPRVSARSN